MTRIIAGDRKGLHLYNPKGWAIRPTTDRTKEWIFSVLYDVTDAQVLDLFCGAGNLGLEALSRGAAECTFVDRSEQAIHLLRKNLERTNYEREAAVRKLDVLRYLDSQTASFDLIFADPPYRYECNKQLFAGVASRLKDHGRFVYETGKESTQTTLGQLTELRMKSLGNTMVRIYGKSDA